MSVICQNFVQNAWRKDLCSNCFKSESDHTEIGCRGGLERIAAGRYIPQAAKLYQARGISTNIHWRPLLVDSGSRLQDKISCRDFGSQTNLTSHRSASENESTGEIGRGILKDARRNKKPRRNTVGFAPEEAFVIGYGGRDYDSDDSPWELASDDGSINLEMLDLTEEDRTITKLTKNNTEFNSVNENLVPVTPQTNVDSPKTAFLNGYSQFTKNEFPTNSTKSQKLDNEKKTVNVTADSQAKKVDYYYFSTREDPQKSNVPRGVGRADSLTQSMEYADQCKEMSIIAQDIPGIINSIQNYNSDIRTNVNNLNEVNLLNDYADNVPRLKNNECQLRNPSNYLLITKVNENSDAGSDSDYSTSRQNNGESSTDSEFHDMEDSMMVPCSSFLHGKSPINEREMRNNTAKPFETSSVSSADMSTFSDDSDFQRPHEEALSDEKDLRADYSKASKHFNSLHTADTRVNGKAIDTCSKERSVIDAKPKESTTGSKTYRSVPVYLHKKSPPLTNRDEVKSLIDADHRTSNAVRSDNEGFSEPKVRSETMEIKIANQPINETGFSATRANSKKEIVPANAETRGSEERRCNGRVETVSCVDSGSQVQYSACSPSEPENRNINCIKETPTKQMSVENKTIVKKMELCDKNREITSVNACTVSSCQNIPSGATNIESVNAFPTAELSEKYRNETERKARHLNEGDTISESKTQDIVNDYAVQRASQQTAVCKLSGNDAAYFQERNENGQLEKDATNSNSNDNSPTSKLNRQSKLAALALELEKVRCDSSSKSSCEFKTPVSPAEPPPLPLAASGKPIPKLDSSRRAHSENTPTSHAPSNKYPSIRRGRSLSSTTQNLNLSSLPDLLPETTTKLKKSKFSLKKLLKRGKDSDTLVINGTSDYNPKAWKNQTFDRSRLSLEIIHPMDLASDSPASTESTPTEDKRHSSIFTDPSGRRSSRNGATRARSLSALPQLISCISEIGESQRSEQSDDTTLSLDRPRLDMTRKAGTVAERSKKYKAPRRTPSFSELRTNLSASGRSTMGGAVSERPPKPPPPPRGKSLPPPQPPTVPPPLAQDKAGKNQQPLPLRPPPPKVPETKEINVNAQALALSKNTSENLNGDYANLGDIRLNITPKKPQRPSAVSFARDTLEMEAEISPQASSSSDRKKCSHHDDNTYESLEVQDEEDHYTYLDEQEIKKENCHKHISSGDDAKNPYKALKCASGGGHEPPRRPEETEMSQCTARQNLALKKPWMDLQASYAAIAAANYESLAELITTAISEGLENLQKSASSLKWQDFCLEAEEPVQILQDKIVYNATYKNESKTKVTLMVTTQKQHNTQPCRNPTRPPVLATFSDYLKRQYINVGSKHHNYSDTTKAIVYVLQRSKTTTVSQFAQDSACFQTNQHVHLRNACFVLLQLIHTLKSLQAEGIEEIDYDLGHILLLHTDVDKPPILVLLPGDKMYLTMTDFYKADVATRKTTLCQTTLQLLFHLLQIQDVTDLGTCVVNGELLASPVAHTFSVISKILSEEKASSLTQAKGLLEYMLWGPVDIKLPGNEQDIDVILQRWLDLQRAQMVKSTVSNLHLKISSHTGFHVYEEYQLIFLLQATVKGLKDIISKL